jgi:hypothetical protein
MIQPSEGRLTAGARFGNQANRQRMNISPGGNTSG